MVNSADPDQMLHSEGPDLGLQFAQACLRVNTESSYSGKKKKKKKIKNLLFAQACLRVNTESSYSGKKKDKIYFLFKLYQYLPKQIQQTTKLMLFFLIFPR